MNSADVIGYSYAADLHCPDCTRKALRHPSRPTLRLPYVTLDVSYDENGIPDNPLPIDDEGNEIGAVFAGNCEQSEYCGDCGAVIYECDDDEGESDD